MTELLISDDLETLCVSENGEPFALGYDNYCELRKQLREWRLTNAKRIGLPAYCIFSDRELDAVLRFLPTEVCQLWLLEGFAETRIQVCGKELIDIVNRFLSKLGVQYVMHGKGSFNLSSKRVHAILGFLNLLDRF